MGGLASSARTSGAQWVLEAGAVALANDGLLALDEIEVRS